jgi:predicted lipid-binding transport protein (Tim44 family)
MESLNLILLVIAAVVAWYLWSLLGTRTGFEKPPIVLQPTPEKTKPQDLDVREGEVLEPEARPPVWQGYAKEGSDVAQGLETIAKRSPQFTVTSFVQGAKTAYELVLEAYAKGDKPALKPLLSKELLDSFAAAIDTRSANGETMTFRFVGVKQADIRRALLQGNKALIDVAFVAEMISATVGKTGETLDGDAKAIRTVTDLWTFERDVTARDPNWKLIATDDDG